MSFSLINVDTMFFKGCFDSRINMHFYHLIIDVGSFLFRTAPAFSTTQTPPSVHSLSFFIIIILCFARPTDPQITRDGAMGNVTFYIFMAQSEKKIGSYLL